MGRMRLTEYLCLVYGPSEGRTVYFTDRKQDLRPAWSTIQKAAQKAPQEGFPMYFLLYFTFLLKQLRKLYTGGFIFQVPPVSDYSTCCANRVPTRLVQQPRVYMFGAPTTRLRVQCTYEALTNQGEAHQYIDLVVCFNIKDSHHRPKEHTILYVFHAPGHDSLVSLN